MDINKLPHTFHIPVMGTGYTIESPLKVAKYGINSVIPLSDHYIMNPLIEIHSCKHNLRYELLDPYDPENRAIIIRQYLNLVNDIVQKQFEEVRNSPFIAGSEITKYFEMLPSNTPLKVKYNQMLESVGDMKGKLQDELRDLMLPGSIDVNIMTKLDGVNYTKQNEPYPTDYNDAHSALRGFAESKLDASLILSAGLNPRLYGYMANFKDFFPDAQGKMKKRIALKVSDYRSAMIQGKFLAKKGLWVSEFRIESGLNCGGHAFATDGYLLGPILNDFKENKKELNKQLHTTYAEVLKKEKDIEVDRALPLLYTVQGGIGDAYEHQMLLDYYGMESVGWGSPFMLVPEATTVDKFTQNLLLKGKENDFYLSRISPLGVPFNSIKGNWADKEKQKRIDEGNPGAVCLKKFLQFNTEFTPKSICTASVQYQKNKISQLKKAIANPIELKEKVDKVVEKVCLCTGLGNTVLDYYKLPLAKGNHGVVVCPGPNLAYFNRINSLREMVNHIYGKTTHLFNNDRPNVFIKELKIYIDYLKAKIEVESKNENTPVKVKYFTLFKANLLDGIAYYKKIFSDNDSILMNMKDKVLSDLGIYKLELEKVLIPQPIK
ncbi:hypothetical protein [Plebeiibacterium marinum]|uniref:Uncharacterized protein n=1 Tax=Plebeiibacterium marinum TaxID=2992111 RepID=A0AAE3MHS6_9BACT|nr:hypothetical protein [Plebeiobacterium marinum]MCW3807317.1 hypothetical protein [Plebeiobacterium marinum]